MKRIPTLPDMPEANQELLRLFVMDQWDRGYDTYGGTQRARYVIDWVQVEPRDEQRHARVRMMILENSLVAAVDFHHAAFILQHGTKPADYLQAHVLACTAVFLGHVGCTLDRGSHPRPLSAQYGVSTIIRHAVFR